MVASGPAPMTLLWLGVRVCVVVPACVFDSRGGCSECGHDESAVTCVRSKAWKSAPADHPDPAAFHLTIVAHMIKVHLERWSDEGILDVAVFWDFGSLHQKNRVGDQDVLFKEGLQASNLWYGSTQSVVWT